MTTRRQLPQSLSASAALASVVPRDNAVPAERFVAPLLKHVVSGLRLEPRDPAQLTVVLTPFGLTVLTAS